MNFVGVNIMVVKELLEKLREDNTLYWREKSDIKCVALLVDVIDEWLKGSKNINIGEIYSINDFFDFWISSSFEFMFVKSGDFVRVAIFDDVDDEEFSGRFICKFKDRYIYIKESKIALLLDKYITDKGLINVKKKYLDVLEDVKIEIGGWMSNQLVSISYVMKDSLKNSKDYYLVEMFINKINDIFNDISNYKIRSFEDYILKKADDILEINNSIDNLIEEYFCDLESEQDILMGDLDIEDKVNEIKEVLESSILNNQELLEKYFDYVIVPKYLLEKYNHDKERLNCIIKFNLIMQEIYEEVTHIGIKNGFSLCCLKMNDKEYDINLYLVNSDESVYNVCDFLNTKNIFWKFKFISFHSSKTLRFSIANLYPFSIYDDCDNIKIYELTEDVVNELISLRDKIWSR